MIATCVTLVVALVVGGTPPEDTTSPIAPSEPAEPVDARTEAAHGEALFLAGEFDEASAAYERAYALDSLAPYLFARARSEQEAGRCAAAIELYREFIATQPPASDVDRANLQIGRCYGETRAATPPPPVVATRPPVVHVDATPPEKRSKWIHDPVGAGLLGSGLIVLAAGLGLFFSGDAMGDKATSAATTDDFRHQISRARALEGAGIAGMTIGSTLVIAAITRFALVARKQRRAGKKN